MGVVEMRSSAEREGLNATVIVTGGCVAMTKGEIGLVPVPAEADDYETSVEYEVPDSSVRAHPMRTPGGLSRCRPERVAMPGLLISPGGYP